MPKKRVKGKSSGGGAAGGSDGDGIMVDPARVRFQFSKIRPFFSGCGRRVEDTLEEIRQGKIKASDLPPIQVLLGPIEEETGEPWYFSLNNRRLWVLKRCREEGLLPNNQVYVRVRKAKSEKEVSRYTVENCALEAKFMLEKPQSRVVAGDGKNGELQESAVAWTGDNTEVMSLSKNIKQSLSLLEPKVDSDDSSSDSSDDMAGAANRFSALF